MKKEIINIRSGWSVDFVQGILPVVSICGRHAEHGSLLLSVFSHHLDVEQQFLTKCRLVVKIEFNSHYR